MASPKLQVALYPKSPGGFLSDELSYQYLQLAPTPSAGPVDQVSLQIVIRNDESSTIRLERIEVFLQDPSTDQFYRSIPINQYIAPGAQFFWYATNDDYLLWPDPPPEKFTLRLHCKNFEPWASFVTFSRFNREFRFPGKTSTLEAGEFFVGEGATHGGGSDQIFHYDMGIIGWDGSRWSDTKSLTDGTANEHYRIWEKSVYAITTGVVVQWENTIEDNPAPGDITQENLDNGAGNFIWVKYDNPSPPFGEPDYIVSYMHLRKGTLNSKLLSVGTPVKPGEFIGKVGYSGTGSHPHLHIGIVQERHNRFFSIPMPFSGIKVVPDSQLDPQNPSASPWVDCQKQGLPYVPDSARAAIWPSTSLPA